MLSGLETDKRREEIDCDDSARNWAMIYDHIVHLVPEDMHPEMECWLDVTINLSRSINDFILKSPKAERDAIAETAKRMLGPSLLQDLSLP